jgi:hypothetical protein
MTRSGSQKKRVLDDCEGEQRKAKLRAMNDADVDFREFRKTLYGMLERLGDLPGSNARRTQIMQAIDGMLALTECDQTMIISL